MVSVAWMGFLPIPLGVVAAFKAEEFDLIDRWPMEEKARRSRPCSRFELDPFHPRHIFVRFDGEKGGVRDVYLCFPSWMRLHGMESTRATDADDRRTQPCCNSLKPSIQPVGMNGFLGRKLCIYVRMKKKRCAVKTALSLLQCFLCILPCFPGPEASVAANEPSSSREDDSRRFGGGFTIWKGTPFHSLRGSCTHPAMTNMFSSLETPSIPS